MKSPTIRSRRTTIRSPREDGEETKTRIVEAAGRLFAERGFSEVTSKEICEAAGTNLTAVNYHFGSREGLYLIVLEEMHEHFSGSEFYAELEASDETPRTKLGWLMDRLVQNVYRRSDWQIRLWAREMLSPTQLAQQLIQEQAAPKFGIMEGLLSEITGVPRGSVPLSFCFINVMAPFMVLLIIGRGEGTPEARVLALGPEKVSRHLKEMVFAGLDNFAARYAAGIVDME